MSKAASFLDAILADPDDDAVRLIYADWLEEQGDDAGVPAAQEYAECIRLQIELSRIQPGDKKPAKKERRERSFLRKYARKWFLPPRGWKIGEHVKVRRGFPFSVMQAAPLLVRHTEDLFARWPITHLEPEDLD